MLKLFLRNKKRLGIFRTRIFEIDLKCSIFSKLATHFCASYSFATIQIRCYDLNKKETNKADGQTDKNRQSSFSSQSLFQTFHFMCDFPLSYVKRLAVTIAKKL